MIAMADVLKDAINSLTAPCVLHHPGQRSPSSCRCGTRRSGSRRSWAPSGFSAVAFLGVSMLDPNFALIVKKPDNVPIVAMLFLVGFFLWLSMHQAITRTTSASRRGEKPDGGQRRRGRQDLGLARPRLHRAALHGHRHDRARGLGHRLPRPHRGGGQPRAHPQPLEGALVLPGPPGDARLLRPLAGRGGVPEPDHRGPHGHPLHRHQPQGERLLHLQGAQGRDHPLPLRLPDPVGAARHPGHLPARPQLELLRPLRVRGTSTSWRPWST